MDPVMIINPQVRKSYNEVISVGDVPAVECEGYEYENSNIRISFRVLDKDLYRDNLEYCKEEMQKFSNEVKANQVDGVTLI